MIDSGGSVHTYLLLDYINRQVREGIPEEYKLDNNMEPFATSQSLGRVSSLQRKTFCLLFKGGHKTFFVYLSL